MKQKVMCIIWLCLPLFGLFAQDGLRSIKAGNTLRETNQFKKAQTYLETGLRLARANKNVYLEAVGCEYLGLLYRDLSNNLLALTNFNKAAKIYKGLNMRDSENGMYQLIQTVTGQGEIYAGIDIGSLGVKLSIVEVALTTTGYNSYRIIKDYSRNTNIVSLTPTAVDETKIAIGAFIDSALGRNIEKDHIYIAASSGVRQEFMRTNRLAEIQQAITTTVKEKLPNYPGQVEFLVPTKEAELTTLGTVIPNRMEKTLTIDVGSGNTKGGYYYTENDGMPNETVAYEAFSIPYGSKTLVNKSNWETYFTDSIKPQMKAEFNRKPGFINRKEVNFMGGAVWAMVSYMYPEKANNEFVSFTLDDVQTYNRLLKSDKDSLAKFYQQKLATIADEDVIRLAMSNVSMVENNTFNYNNLKAGGQLMLGMMQELQVPGVKKNYAFLRFGVVGWISGYIVKNISAKFTNSEN